MATKKTTPQTNDELTKQLSEKQTELANLLLSVGGFKPTEKKNVRKDIARIKTAIRLLAKSAKTL